ncbi:DUF5681 domain-containing protein [Erythrobacter crassostreae]|uniref:DUF5681 domain-containing protein n=1 Tax=Erythrobacter crassostreae TaxID=2828328 RepID=A0A9X1F0P0_9SPHN|nr:DUF5681 domain-containing protein [Erythrobacter crassostrea]MBV7257969.1 hypothetical protein [Erythrobacter crassostrea]
MSKGASTRFTKGQSGNPKGRPPKPRRPNISAFEIILDKTLITARYGKQREATVEEALQQQTLKDAFAGKRMAIRKVLKMIEKREAALAKKNGSPPTPIALEGHHGAQNANEAMRILGISEPEAAMPSRWKLMAWAAQAALTRAKSKRFTAKDVGDMKFFTFDADTIRWPRGHS